MNTTIDVESPTVATNVKTSSRRGWRRALVSVAALAGAVTMLAGDPAFATTRAWGRTEASNSAPWGQCTWGAKEQFKAATGVYPALYGNAQDWDTSARNAGWTVVLDAEARSIVVFEPGVQGANRTYGHVAWVEWVEYRADGRWIHVLEMNWTGVGQWSRRTVKDVAGMSYILAP